MKREEKTIFATPPRLMLGMAFLFWGAMQDEALAGLLGAVLVEMKNWVRFRWEFSEKFFLRAWQFSVLILITLVVGVLQSDALEFGDFLRVLTWLPFVGLPLLMVQEWSRDGAVPISTFSFVARRRMILDRKAGRPVVQWWVRLGYPYVLFVLVCAGMGAGFVLTLGAAEKLYLFGAAGFLGWMIFQQGSRKKRSVAWVMAFLVSVVMAGVMGYGVMWGYQYLMGKISRPGDRGLSSFEYRASLGQVQELQLSPKILWRYDHEAGEVPKLLPLARYDWIEGDMWRTRARRMSVDESVREGWGKDVLVGGEEGEWWLRGEERRVGEWPVRGRIQGLVRDRSMIPQISGTGYLGDLPVETVVVNTLGAIQVSGLKSGAVDYRVAGEVDGWRMGLDPDSLDLQLPRLEREGLKDYLAELGLKGRDWGMGDRPRAISAEEFREIEQGIARDLRERFRYTLFLTGTARRAPMSEFLNETREGHCEYFAGAATLLMRSMGIPTRYVVGFSVQERGSQSGEYLLRGRHAHAWAEAYVGGVWQEEEYDGERIWVCRGGKWVEIDWTPSSWLESGEEFGWSQRFSDWLGEVRYLLVKWMGGGGFLRGLLWGLLLVGLGTLGVAVFRWFRGRSGRLGNERWERRVRAAGQLKELEKWLAKRVGRRPAGMPMGVWLRAHLPEECEKWVGIYERVVFGGGEADLREGIARMKEGRRQQEKTQ